MTDTQRRTRRPITNDETQRALTALVLFAGPDKVSPAPGIAPSATSTIQQELGVTDSRAGYLLDILLKGGAVERIEHSRKVRILRPTVISSVKPSLSMSDYEKMKAALIALDKECGELRLRNSALERQLGELSEQLAEMEKSSVAIDADVLSIIERHLPPTSA